MCLTTNNPEIKIAQEDIIVYKKVNFPKWKILRFFYVFSYFKDYKYIRNKLNKFIKLTPIEEHSGSARGHTHAVYEGYHAYKNLFHVNAIFIIPKGTPYIEDNDAIFSEIVASTIIFKKILK